MLTRFAIVVCLTLNVLVACSNQSPSSTKVQSEWPYLANPQTYDRYHLSQEDRDFIERMKRTWPAREELQDVRWARCGSSIMVFVHRLGDRPSIPSRQQFENDCRGRHRAVEITNQDFVRLIQQVPLATSRENVVAFLDKHKAFFDHHEIVVSSSRARFPDEFVHVVLKKHEHAAWNPSVQADYVFKHNKLICYQFRELHLP